MRVLACACSAVLLGCGSDPGGPTGTPVAAAIGGGDGQTRFPGATLTDRLTLGLVDGAGSPARESGVPVRWDVVQGDGTVEATSDTTGPGGTATATWTLGPDLGTQMVQATAADFDPITFAARAVEPGPIVFVSSRFAGFNGNAFDGFPGDLFVMNEDGSDVVLLTGKSFVDYVFHPTWSPAGDRILFARSESRPAGGIPGLVHRGIHVINANATREQQVPAAGFPIEVSAYRHPSWSSGGFHIVVGSALTGQLHTMNADGSNPRQFTDLPGLAHTPAWSPRDDVVAFVCSAGAREAICAIDGDGTDLRQLTDGSHDDGEPVWSPDGTRIMFSRDTLVEGGIWMMNADGSGLTQVLTGPVTSPAWSPDGARALITMREGNQTDVYLVDLATGATTNLTQHDAMDREASWRWDPPSPSRPARPNPTPLPRRGRSDR